MFVQSILIIYSDRAIDLPYNLKK